MMNLLVTPHSESLDANVTYKFGAYLQYSYCSMYAPCEENAFYYFKHCDKERAGNEVCLTLYAMLRYQKKTATPPKFN